MKASRGRGKNDLFWSLSRVCSHVENGTPDGVASAKGLSFVARIASIQTLAADFERLSAWARLSLIVCRSKKP